MIPILAFDPGLIGGVALLANGRTTVMPMPITRQYQKARKGRKGAWGRKQYAVLEIVGLVRRAHQRYPGLRVVVERSQPMPHRGRGSKGEGHGAVASFRLGDGFGLLRGIATAITGEEPVLVSPRTWQAMMYEGLDKEIIGKQRSIEACFARFPEVSLLATPRSKTPHPGLADALLIAEWGRRSLTG